MVRVEGGRARAEGQSSVGAAVDEDCVGQRDSVVGYADLVDRVCGNPFSVVDGNARAGGVDEPGLATVSAAADEDVYEAGSKAG